MFSKLRSLRAELGIVDAALYTVDRALRLLSRDRASLARLYLMAQNLREESSLLRGRGGSIVVREATIEDVERLDWVCGRDVARVRLSLGMVGLLAFRGDRFIGYIWVSLGSYRDELLPVEFVPSPAIVSAWSLDLFIHPDHRRSFAFPRLWAAVFALMRERRLEWIMSSISATNRLSIASHESLGAVCVGHVVALVVGRLVAALQLPGPHFTVAWARRPRIIVRVPI